MKSGLWGRELVSKAGSKKAGGNISLNQR